MLHGTFEISVHNQTISKPASQHSVLEWDFWKSEFFFDAMIMCEYDACVTAWVCEMETVSV